jgi:uncharacterized membrane protein
MSSARPSEVSGAAPGPASPRLPLVDALRGFAVAQMIVYHFIYDLVYFGWLQLAMTRDAPWVQWRSAIVTQFLLLVGVGLVLRDSFKPAWADFWRRWAQIAGAAALVSAGSWFLFGPRLIWFGILHFIAVALIIVRLLRPLGPWNVALALAVLPLAWVLATPALNAAPWNVLGWVTVKPRTEDYVPLFPWLAAVLFGAGLASLWQRRGWALWPACAALNRRPPRLLVWLGTWSLTVYLVHQPLLMGVLWLVRRFA